MRTLLMAGHRIQLDKMADVISPTVTALLVGDCVKILDPYYCSSCLLQFSEDNIEQILHFPCSQPLASGMPVFQKT